MNRLYASIFTPKKVILSSSAQKALSTNWGLIQFIYFVLCEIFSGLNAEQDKKRIWNLL